MSDFRHLPSQDEIRKLDPRWVGDMKLAHTIYSHQGNNSFEMQMMEKLEAQRQRREMGLPLDSDDDGDDDDGLMPMGMPNTPKPRRPRR